MLRDTANLTRSHMPDFLDQRLSLPISKVWKHDRPTGTWRSLLNPKLVNYVENWNAVDMELYDFAKRLFYGRYHEHCEHKGP
mmetsp:Transcript_76160/g.230921  ORF Transcript_76160/g.230921 Transcript_76160/m.230921 type:complete len:82 (-) Transcript_76160:32-277(-)